MFRNFNNINDFDDLVFENRNKEYGAYQLRKKQKKAVIIGVVVASLFATLAVVVPFALYLDNEETFSVGLSSYYSVQLENLELPPIDEIFMSPPPPPPQVVELIPETVRYAPPVVVDSISPEEERFATMDEVLSETPIEDSDLDVIGSGDYFLSDIFGGTGFGGDGDGAFTYAEVMSTFRGGDVHTFGEWVQRRIVYSQTALDARIQGRVFATFIVETDGTVTNVVILQGIGAIIDDEVVRVIQSSPRWTPALQQGRPVRMRFSFSLNFLAR